jgi:hypothetical protein
MSRGLDWRRPSLATLSPFLPAVALLGLWFLWVPLDGGYFPRVWYPSAIFAVALLASVALLGRRWRPPARAGRVALALLAALTAWSFLSLLWGESPGSGWAASDELLLYLAIAWLAALVPWRAGHAAVLLGLWAVGVGVVCAVELASGMGASSFGHYIFESRWQQPTGYANAAAALPAMAFWPAVMLSSRRAVPAPLQVLFLVVAAFLVEFSMLPQSRGWVLAVLLALPVFVALSPDRRRLLVRLAILAVGIAMAGGDVWNLYSTGEAHHPLAPALDSAARSILVSSGIVALLGTVAVIAERQIRPGVRLGRAVRRGELAVVGLVALAAVGVAVARAGDIADYASERWADFSSSRELPADTNPSRIAQRTSDKRYDYWRVSVATFRDSPVGGVGAGGFERVYSKERRHYKPSKSPHSIWMRSLAETGAVGTALFLALLAALGFGLLRVRRRLDDLGRGIVAACAAIGVYFLGHASLDWLELFPALAAPAVALPFVALRLAAPAEDPAVRPSDGWRVGRALGAAGGVVLAALAIASLILPYLSDRYVNSALHSWRADPAGASRDLRHASALNPLSPDPRLAQGRIALVERRYATARRAFEQALEREDDWFPHFELALLDALRGRFAPARREIARAHALNPPDLLVTRAAALIAQRKRIDPTRITRKPITLPLYTGAPHL